MHYRVYVLCNPARTLFFLGVTGGFTDGIFDLDAVDPPKVSLWINCKVLVHHKAFRELADVVIYMDQLQQGINRWTFKEIEKKNRGWKDLSAQWLNPSQLLSFQSIRNSFYCLAN
jgi:succinylarginine dihydrolase